MKCTLAWARTFPPLGQQRLDVNLPRARESVLGDRPGGGRKDDDLFRQGTEATWVWAQEAFLIRWFTDGERRYGKTLWPLASEYLPERGFGDELSLP